MPNMPHEDTSKPILGEKHRAAFLNLSQEKKDFILNNYLSLNTSECVKFVGRPGSMIKSFAVLLGLPAKRSLCKFSKNNPSYNSWRAMKGRCLDKNNEKYPSYGGKGISICLKWMEFDGFLDDMGIRPTGHTLDRIESSGNYEKSNCRWATPKLQARMLVKYDGFKCVDCNDRRPIRNNRCHRCSEYFRIHGKPRR